MSPLLGARFAVEKVEAGCRRLRNFLIHPHGPAFRRPGMEYMGASMGADAKSSLRGFSFSTTTNAILEFHPSGLAVWSNGKKVPISAVPLVWRDGATFTAEECAELQLAQVNDVVYLAHPNHEPMMLVRGAHGGGDLEWELKKIDWKWPALGDENVRSAELSSPETTDKFSKGTWAWPEFSEVPGDQFKLTVVNPHTATNALKTIRLYSLERDRRHQYYWKLLRQITWRLAAPAAWETDITAAGNKTLKIEYTGPTGPDGSKAVLAWPKASPTETRELDLHEDPPNLLQEVDVPAGDWKVEVHCPTTIPTNAPAVPADKTRVGAASCTIQRLVKGTWQPINLPLIPGGVAVYRGPNLRVPGKVRLRWNGYAVMDGTMKVIQLTFKKSDELTLEVDAADDVDRTMTAKKGEALVPMFEPGHVGSYWQISHRREQSFVTIEGARATAVPPATPPNHKESPSIRVSGKWEVFTYGHWSATLTLQRNIGGNWETMRSWSAKDDRNIAVNGEEDGETEMRLRVTEATATEDDDEARFVLEASDAIVNGLVQITAVGALDEHGKASSATVDVIRDLFTVDPSTPPAPTPIWTEGAWSKARGFPRAVGLHGQRLWFGGTKAEPQRVWGSVVNDYQNFRRTSLDDAGVSFTPAAQTANPIQWLASSGALVMGTSGDEWTIGADGDGLVTPTNVKFLRRSGNGSQYLPAQILGDVLVFVQRNGLKLRQVAPRAENVVWSSTDLTVLAEHLTQAGRIVQLAVMNSPATILWAVTADGRLLGMTFEQEQNVFGWHVHETEGFVESVAVIYGPGSDEVWLAVRRGGKRNIERLDAAVLERKFAQRERLMYLDAAVRVEAAAPVTQVTGLAHLLGQLVDVVGDGAQQSARTVTRTVDGDGVVVLETPAKTVIVGLPYVSELQPMRKELPLQDGTAQHRNWKLARVGLWVHDSLGGEIADAPDPASKAEKINYRRASTAMDGAPPLSTGEVETAIEPRTREGFDVIIRQRAPLPLNIGSITLKGDVHGE